MSDVAIEVDHLWKRFRRGTAASLRDAIPGLVKRVFRPRKEGELREREFWALQDVTFQVRRGEALGIIGPNGAGKSTVLKLLSGILRPNKGSLRVMGRISALIEVAAGFHPDLTGRENVYLNGSILGMTRREIDRKYERIVDFAEIEEFMDTPVKRYSSGMYARLGFAVAAHVDPDVLLVDEVLSVGDMAFQRKCLDKMHERLSGGVTVVFVSHNLHAVATLCDRVTVLDRGATIYEGSPERAVSHYMEAAERLPGQHEPAVEVVEARIGGSDGAGVNECAPGDPVTLDVALRFKKPAKEPTISLVINRVTDGLRVFEMAAQECGLPRRSFAVGEVVRLRFRFRMNLLRGLYAVGINALIPQTHKVILRMPSIGQIAVNENRSDAGVADLRLSVDCLDDAPASGD